MQKSNIELALKRSRVSVFFFDELQLLNMEEKGTKRNFLEIINKHNKTYKEFKLKCSYRVDGGTAYNNWVEELLKNPESIGKLDRVWKNNYELRVFNNLENMMTSLKEKITENIRVGLLASFTESPGDIKDHNSIKNRRIGYPLYSGFELYKELNKEIFWLMDPKKDYIPFWLDGESNSLEKCASIYGCQGFEIDYSGLIWGRDFVYRNGTWELGENCEDDIGEPSLKYLFERAAQGKKDEEELALKFLQNRYRIFLTRGIKGTYIFCENRETGKFLKKLIANNISS